MATSKTQPAKPVAKTPVVHQDLRASTAPTSASTETAKPEKAKRDRSTLYAKWVYNGEQVITKLVDGNPKATRKPNGKAAARFAFYRNGMKVSELMEIYTKNSLKKGKLLSNVRWDIAHGLIKVA